MKKRLINIFYCFMFLIFIYLIINIIFNNKTGFSNPVMLAVFSVVYIIIFFLLYKFFITKIKNKKKLFIISFFVLFIVQLLFGYLFAVRPTWDFGAVNDSVIWDLTNTMKLNNNNYFYRYNNNIGIFLFLKLFYSFIYLFTSSSFVLKLFGMLLNIFLIDVGIIFLYKIFNLFFNDEEVNLFLLLTLVFTPFITYVPIFYTDTFSLPFGIMSLYYYFYYFNSGIKHKRYIIMSGFLLGIGCCLKFSLFIIFIAIIIYNLVREKFIFKKFIFVVGNILISMIIPIVCLNIYTKVTFDSEWIEKESFPIWHYFMMGLKNDGGYNQEDVDYTSSFNGKDNKKKRDIKVLRERLSNYISNGELLSFYTRKAVYTWGDGTFFAHRKLALEPVFDYKIREYVIEYNGNNYAYKLLAQVQSVLMLIFIVIGIFYRKYLSKKQQDLQILLNIIIFGVFVFFLMWEARSRYIVNFIPILLLSSYLGIVAIKRRYSYFKL